MNFKKQPKREIKSPSNSQKLKKVKQMSFDEWQELQRLTGQLEPIEQ